MRSSKDRTIEKKRRNKAMKVQKTEASRRRRIANKHKREEIHAIDPDMKVIIMNQKTFDEHGTEIEVMDGKIRAVKLDDEIIKATMDFCRQSAELEDPADRDDRLYHEEQDNKAVNVVEKIEARNKSAFRRLTDKLRGSHEK